MLLKSTLTIKIFFSFKFFLNFYWVIITYNIILLSGIQHIDLIFLYVMKWSPLWDQLPLSPPILFLCHISTSVLRLCPPILSQLRWVSLSVTSFWGNQFLCLAAPVNCLECLFVAWFTLSVYPLIHINSNRSSLWFLLKEYMYLWVLLQELCPYPMEDGNFRLSTRFWLPHHQPIRESHKPCSSQPRFCLQKLLATNCWGSLGFF